MSNLSSFKPEAYWKKLGPGLTTGAADDDPSGIATYSQTGAQYGTQLVWLAIFTFPLMGVIQEMCARIGIVTGRGLASNIKTHFPRSILIVCTLLLFAANTFNIGADLGAMAAATRLLFPTIDASFLVIFFTLFSLILQIFTSYKAYARYLKWLTLVLFSYVAVGFTIALPWGEIFHNMFVPHVELNRGSLLIIAAILGTTISPYLFFWQSSQEVEEDVGTLENHPVTEEHIKNMRVDVWTGMFVSNLAMFFIIIVCSATLNASGITNIQTAADAAAALRPLAGNTAYLLFAIGIIGTGLLAVPVLAGSVSYAIGESMNWTTGLNRKFKEARAFYGVLILAMLVGLALNFVGLDPIKALIYSAVANCIAAPLILVCIVILSSSKKLMGAYSTKPLGRFFGWLVTGIMACVAIATLINF